MKWYIWTLCILGGFYFLVLATRLLGAVYEGFIDDYYHRKIQGQLEIFRTHISELQKKVGIK